MAQRDMLAEILADADVETLRHLVNEGMDQNTVRAPSSDLAYREAWPMAETGSTCPTQRPVAEIR
ncbi:hypothetical protein [Brucella pseudogrignonensis]|uniref:hypothetical protein n=1 Tax=Brucella pseudogrignonensis TaxID=419475 RepID=UPI00124CDAA9|nr:hypothetical protein [Brucella pseudogrignonensis]KAB2684306.1 hypothetical protein F9K82_22965 [Brucella pseudogrignonensis]